ncbi:MAG: hypothetical protein ACOCV3_01565 [Halanaerobiales bacterium]
MFIKEDWRHIKKKDIEAILQGDSEEWLKDWFNYHLKENGHNCRKCKNRVREVISNYLICFKSKGRLWSESETGGTNLLELARETTGIDNLSFNQLLDGVYTGNVCKYCLVPGNTINEKDVDTDNIISVLVENNLFSKLGLMEIVESLSHKNAETGQLELISFEWAVNDNLLLTEWEKAGFPIKWGRHKY